MILIQPKRGSGAPHLTEQHHKNRITLLKQKARSSFCSNLMVNVPKVPKETNWILGNFGTLIDVPGIAQTWMHKLIANVLCRRLSLTSQLDKNLSSDNRL